MVDIVHGRDKIEYSVIDIDSMVVPFLLNFKRVFIVYI